MKKIILILLLLITGCSKEEINPLKQLGYTDEEINVIETMNIENVNYNFNKGFAEKILTDNELKEYNTKNDKDKSLYLLKCWCAKESIFKASDKDTFHPSEIEYNTNTKIDIINVNNDNFCYSVCSCNTNFINIYNNINL